jgi:transcriptional regulator GlxA family with amidase domain
VEALREHAKDATVLDDVRNVAEENLVTATGVSAGIDMAFWLVGQIWDEELACTVTHFIPYDPAPPYPNSST